MEIIEIKNGNLNKVFKLKIENSVYIIRSSDFDNTFESEILKLLELYKVNTPRIKTNFKFNGKFVMIYDYIIGENPIIYDNNFFTKLIMELKKIHKINIKKIKNVNYNLENKRKLEKFYNIAIKSKILKDEQYYLSYLLDKIIKNLCIDKLPQFLIHSDIKKENILVNNKKLYLIDFGNCYIGNRLIDIIRIFMWFFIKENNYDLYQMQKIINLYFKNNINITSVELQNIELLIEFCLLYNLLKDVYLYEKKLLPIDYINENSLLWLKALKDKDSILRIKEFFLNAKRFTK